MEEFNEDKIGKQLPYSIPPGFFENITQETLHRIQEEQAPAKSQPITKWRVLSLAASLALLFTLGYFLQDREGASEARQSVVEHKQVPSAKKAEQAPYLEQRGITEKVAQPHVASLNKLEEVPPQRRVFKAENVSKKTKEETLDEILASLSDQELSQLASIAEAESTGLEEIPLR